MKGKKLTVGLMAALMFCMVFSVRTFAADNWKQVGKDRYFYQDDGTMQKGWLTYEGKKYFFNRKTGVMVTGIHKIAGKTYLFGDDGALVKTYKKAGFRKTSSGKIWYYFGKNTDSPKKQWLVIDGKTYYFNKNGYALVGWKKVKGYTYYFNKKGVLQTNKWMKYKTKKMYLGEDGRIAKDTWIGDKYVDEDGGYIPGYRDDRRTSDTKTGWAGYDKKWKYYVNNVPVKGWKKISGKKFYFDTDGLMHTGWLKIKGHYYFMDTRSVAIGQMITGWCKISNKYYYFFKTKTKANDITYPKGSMAQGVSIRFTLSDGSQKIYVFDANGVCTNY